MTAPLDAELWLDKNRSMRALRTSEPSAKNQVLDSKSELCVCRKNGRPPPNWWGGVGGGGVLLVSCLFNFEATLKRGTQKKGMYSHRIL